MRIGRRLEDGDRTSVEVRTERSVGTGPCAQELELDIVKLWRRARRETIRVVIPIVDLLATLTKDVDSCAEIGGVLVRLASSAPEGHEKHSAESAGVLFEWRRPERTIGQVLRRLLDSAAVHDELAIHALKMGRTQAEQMSRLWG